MEHLPRLPQVFGAHESFVGYKEHGNEYNCRNTDWALWRPKQLWHSLPMKNFDQALLWCSQAKTPRYCNHPKRQPTSIIAPPTWSWSSIKGRLRFSPTSELLYGPLTRRGQGQSYGETKIPGCQEPTRALHCFEWKRSYTNFYLVDYAAPQLMLVIAMAEGCMSQGIQIEPCCWTKSCYLDAANSMGMRWPRYQDFWAECFSSTTPHTPTQDIPRPGTLLGHVQVSSLKVSRHQHHMTYRRRYRVMKACLEIREGTSCIGVVGHDFPITIAAGDIERFECVVCLFLESQCTLIPHA